MINLDRSSYLIYWKDLSLEDKIEEILSLNKILYELKNKFKRDIFTKQELLLMSVAQLEAHLKITLQHLIDKKQIDLNKRASWLNLSGRLPKLYHTEQDRIVSSSEVLNGQPCIKGLKVTVNSILDLYGAGLSTNEILERFPYLEEEDLDAAIEYFLFRVLAAKVLT